MTPRRPIKLGMDDKKPRMVLPSGRTTSTFPAEEMQGVVESLFAKAGLPAPGQIPKNAAGLESKPRTRSEAKWAIENAMDGAVDYYSSPENLQSLSDELRYLLPRYGVEFGDEDGPLDPATKAAMDHKFKETLKDPASHAVYTNLLTKIYNGSVDRLQKVAAKSGNRSILQMGDLVVGADGKAVPEEVTKIGEIPKLQEAYRDAVKRDHDYMYELVEGQDGQTKIVKKKAPGVSDWMKNTAGDMSKTGSTDEAIGYFMGSSARALFRLLPGFVGAGFRREVEKSSDIRAEQAKILEQIDGLSKKKTGETQARGAAAVGGNAEGQSRSRSQSQEGNKTPGKGERGAAGGGPEVIDVEFEVLEDRPKGGDKTRTSSAKSLARGREGTLLLEESRGRERD